MRGTRTSQRPARNRSMDRWRSSSRTLNFFISNPVLIGIIGIIHRLFDPTRAL